MNRSNLEMVSVSVLVGLGIRTAERRPFAVLDFGDEYKARPSLLYDFMLLVLRGSIHADSGIRNDITLRDIGTAGLAWKVKHQTQAPACFTVLEHNGR